MKFLAEKNGKTYEIIVSPADPLGGSFAAKIKNYDVPKAPPSDLRLY